MVLRRLKYLLRLQKPQILTTFLFHANVLGRIAGRRAGVKHIVSGIRVAERAARWHLWLDRLTQHLVDRYVCVSQSVADFSANDAHLPDEKIMVIPNGIDLARYPAKMPADLAELHIPRGSAVATFVGRLEPQKGLDWLLESARSWLANSETAHLLLVGDGPLRAKLAAKSDELGLGPKVHFAGWRPDVAELLAASRLLVLPSRWEGMPNVVLEAMASAKPVVATDVEGVRELLGPLAPGQTVAYGDSAALGKALERFLASESLAAETGVENRRRVEAHFDITAAVRSYEALWEDLAKQ